MPYSPPMAAFTNPIPCLKPGLVASRPQGNLNNWGLTHYFKALVSGQQVKHSKPDPEIFLLAAEKLGTAPAHTLVLEDSYNGVRAGAAGGFVTVMVPDLLPADDEMRGLYTMECTSLNEVLAKLKTGEL